MFCQKRIPRQFRHKWYKHELFFHFVLPSMKVCFQFEGRALFSLRPHITHRTDNFPTSGTSRIYAGINLTGYHPPPPPPRGTPGLLHRNVCPAAGFCTTENARGGPKNDDVPGAGHLHQLAFKHENCSHCHLSLN